MWVNIKLLVKGLNAAPGAASGKVIFDTLEAVAEAKKGTPVILVRTETSPDDIQGIAVSKGVLTQKGGLTSHAAVVTRAMGIPCICGAEGIEIDTEAKHFIVNWTSLLKKAMISPLTVPPETSIREICRSWKVTAHQRTRRAHGNGGWF